MEINWLGHACFRLKGSHVTIITDPFPPTLGYTLGKPTARIVTVSHPHPSHSYIQGVGGEPKIVSGPGEFEINNVGIMGVATHHDADAGKTRGKNTVYLIELDGLDICHLGDLGHVLTSAQVEAIGDVDVLLLPVGGVSTISASTAAEIVRQLDPKVIIPMHYQTPAITRELRPVSEFLKEMGKESITPQPKLNVGKSSLPLSPQVVLLSY
ncbi:MAG: MBL fold metallo-hydrolase [Chloroflexota bacterium]